MGAALLVARSSVEQRMRMVANVGNPVMAVLVTLQVRLNCCCFDLEVDGPTSTILDVLKGVEGLNPVLGPSCSKSRPDHLFFCLWWEGGERALYNGDANNEKLMT